MQFIDQASAYNAKSLSLDQALKAGRAKLISTKGCEKMLACFHPDLESATGFDSNIDPKVKFNDMLTPDKLDLMIAKLLPGFYHADRLPNTGQDSWKARFVIDGNVVRTVQIDADGLRAVENDDEDPAFELETDIMTLMAILRNVIAAVHTKKLDLAAFGVATAGENANETVAS